MIEKYCSKQDRRYSGLLSMRVCTLLFNNRFNPAMSDKTLIKPHDFTDRDFNAENAENAEKKTFFSLISVTSANSAMKNSCVICGWKMARKVLPTSCSPRWSFGEAGRFKNSSEQRVASNEEITVTSSENRVAREIKNPIYSLLSTHYYSSILDTIYSLLNLGWGFDVRFNPAMSDKTLIKPLKAQKAQKIKNSVYSVFSVVNNGKWVLPTSCRFKAVRSEKRGVRSFVLLPAYCSQLTAHGAMHQNKSCQN